MRCGGCGGEQARVLGCAVVNVRCSLQVTTDGSRI